jgi:hypothetical protein
MRKVQILPATEQHAAEILPHVRQADIDEFYAAALIGPEEVLRRSMAASSVNWSGIINGEVHVWGLSCVNAYRVWCPMDGWNGQA